MVRDMLPATKFGIKLHKKAYVADYKFVQMLGFIISDRKSTKTVQYNHQVL